VGGFLNGGGVVPAELSGEDRPPAGRRRRPDCWAMALLAGQVVVVSASAPGLGRSIRHGTVR